MSSTLTSSLAIWRPCSRLARPSSRCPRMPTEVPRLDRAWPSTARAPTCGPPRPPPGRGPGPRRGGPPASAAGRGRPGRGPAPATAARRGWWPPPARWRPSPVGCRRRSSGSGPAAPAAPGPQRLGGRVDPVQGQPTQGDRPVVVAGQVGRLGGAVQHRAPVQGAAGGRLGRLVPQVQGPLVVPQGLGQGRGRLGGLPGLHAGQQGLPQVVGGVPVVGELARSTALSLAAPEASPRRSMRRSRARA